MATRTTTKREAASTKIAEKPVERARRVTTRVNPEVGKFLDKLASDPKLQKRMRAAGDKVISVANSSGHTFSRAELFHYMIKKWGIKKQPLHDDIDTCTICFCI